MMKKKKKKKKMEKEGINEGEEDEDAEVTKEKYGIAGGLKMDRRRAAGCELFDGVERGGGRPKTQEGGKGVGNMGEEIISGDLRALEIWANATMKELPIGPLSNGAQPVAALLKAYSLQATVYRNFYGLEITNHVF